MKDEQRSIQSKINTEHWLLLWIEKVKHINKDKITLEQPLYYYGIDSIDLATLVGDYELYTNKELTFTDLTNDLNLNELIMKLSPRSSKPKIQTE